MTWQVSLITGWIPCWIIIAHDFFFRYQVIGNNCQDWVEWLLCEIDPELARAMYQRGVRKASETFVGHILKQNKHWTERLPSSLNSSSSMKRSVPRQPRRVQYFKIHTN